MFPRKQWRLVLQTARDDEKCVIVPLAPCMRGKFTTLKMTWLSAFVVVIKLNHLTAQSEKKKMEQRIMQRIQQQQAKNIFKNRQTLPFIFCFVLVIFMRTSRVPILMHFVIIFVITAFFFMPAMHNHETFLKVRLSSILVQLVLFAYFSVKIIGFNENVIHSLALFVLYRPGDALGVMLTQHYYCWINYGSEN